MDIGIVGLGIGIPADQRDRLPEMDEAVATEDGER